MTPAVIDVFTAAHHHAAVTTGRDIALAAEVTRLRGEVVRLREALAKYDQRLDTLTRANARLESTEVQGAGAAVKVPERLAHLRRDRRGIPVPYINVWGAEDATRLRIAHDRNVRRPGVFLDDTSETTPDFTRQNMGRQRECMAAGRCQVCARPVPWSRRFLVIAPLSVERIELAGRRDVPVVYEPWLDQWCADFATTRCPALIRRREDEDFHLVPITSKRQVVFAVSVGWLEGPLEEESRRVQPAMWVKAALPGVLL